MRPAGLAGSVREAAWLRGQPASHMASPSRAHLWISRVCTPYLLSTRYLPGSAAWLSRHPSLYLDGETLTSVQRRPEPCLSPALPHCLPVNDGAACAGVTLPVTAVSRGARLEDTQSQSLTSKEGAALAEF